MASNREYDLFLKRIANNIKVIRQSKGLTQELMADHGFNYRHYQKLESGTHSFNLHTLFRLSKVFDVKIQKFFE